MGREEKASNLLWNQIFQLLFYNLSEADCDVLGLLADTTLQAVLYPS